MFSGIKRPKNFLGHIYTALMEMETEMRWEKWWKEENYRYRNKVRDSKGEDAPAE